MNKIPYEERAKVYTNAREAFGDGAQLMKALEELTEVQLEIHRTLNGRGDLAQLAEEVADATIMLEQVRQIFDINEEVCEFMDAKVRRLRRRIELANDLEKYNITPTEPKELKANDNEGGRAGAAAPRG